MRQFDLNPGALRAQAPTAATRPNVAPARPAALDGAVDGTGFGPLFRQVRGDVDAFIAAGGDSGAPPGAALTPQGRLYRAQAGAGVAGVEAGDAGTDDAARRQFLEQISPWAKETGQRLGVAPHIVAAHAALESGWGRHPLRQADGADSHNLFGIKAGGRWRGEVASAATTEYVDGAAQATTAAFRSYPDQASAFRDYAQLLLDNPRYRAALHTGADAGAFAQGLARGGYASDPAYAAKLSSLAGQLQGAYAAPAAAGRQRGG